MKIKITHSVLLAWALAAMNGLAQPTLDPNTPVNQTNRLGSDAIFCVNASGTPPLSYQWRSYQSGVAFTNIPGATNACFTLTNVAPITNRFRVVVCDPSGCATSRLAMLTALVPPIITNQPTDQVVGLGENYTNRVVVGGDSPLRFQWYFVADGTTNLLVGKTASTLVITNVQFTNAGGYFVVVTNLVGTNISLVATMQVVTLPPAIVVQPANATVEPGQTYTNRVVASGTAPLSYQWYFNGEPLTGKTNSTITIANIQATNAGGYSVVVTNLYGSVTSRLATLFVGPGATFTKITTGPVVTDILRAWNGMWGDYDGDGWLDLVVEGDYWNSGRNTRLYHNTGNGQFTSVTNSPMFNATDRASYSPWVDLDNDGDLDLFMGTWEGEVPFVYLNQGGGEFSRVAPPLDVPIRGNTLSWADYDGDGFLDAFLGINSTAYSGGRNSLLHNNGDGTFGVVTNQPMCLAVTGEETSAWVDYDNDGDLDLFAARTALADSRLYRNDGAGQFIEATPEPIRSEVRRSIGGAWADFDNDGDLDVFFVGFNEPMHFYLNEGHGTFVRWAGQPTVLTSVVNGAGVWGDYDNDGYLDLFVTQFSGSPGCRLFRNQGDGNFSEIRSLAPVTAPPNAQSAAWGDCDNDGFLDLFVASLGSGANRLFRNDGNTNHWLKVRLKGTASNSHGVGARVFTMARLGGNVVRQMRQITAQSIIQELEAHFGLGDASSVEIVRVEWPSGHVTEVPNVTANQFLTIQEPPGLDCVRQIGGALQLRAVGNIGERYDLWTSSNIAAPATNWVRWQTITNTSRTMTLTDPSPNAPHRFYKATPAQ